MKIFMIVLVSGLLTSSFAFAGTNSGAPVSPCQMNSSCTPADTGSEQYPSPLPQGNSPVNHPTK